MDDVIQGYRKVLSSLINPKTKSHYIDFNKKFNKKCENPFWASIKTTTSPMGYTLRMPRKIFEFTSYFLK